MRSRGCGECQRADDQGSSSARRRLHQRTSWHPFFSVHTKYACAADTLPHMRQHAAATCWGDSSFFCATRNAAMLSPLNRLSPTVQP